MKNYFRFPDQIHLVETLRQLLAENAGVPILENRQFATVWLHDADMTTELRFARLGDMRLIVSRIALKQHRTGCFSKIMSLLEQYARMEGIETMVVQCAQTDAVLRWCEKNGFRPDPCASLCRDINGRPAGDYIKTLAEHKSEPELDFAPPDAFRAKARAMTGEWVSGYYLPLDGRHFIINDQHTHVVDPGTLCAYDCMTGQFLGDYLHGTETGEYGTQLSSWTGRLTWDPQDQRLKVRDLGENDLTDTDDYAFNKAVPAFLVQTPDPPSANTPLLSAILRLDTAIQYGLPVHRGTPYGCGNAQKYGYTIRSVRRLDLMFQFVIAVHSDTRTGIHCRDGDCCCVQVTPDTIELKS